MRIRIIGAGFIGRAVARFAVQHGHNVMLGSSRHPKTLASAMVAVGARPGRRVVSELLHTLGFDVVDAGPLAEDWRAERARPASCVPLAAYGLTQRLANAGASVAGGI